jgi:hypothetical protein
MCYGGRDEFLQSVILGPSNSFQILIDFRQDLYDSRTAVPEFHQTQYSVSCLIKISAISRISTQFRLRNSLGRTSRSHDDPEIILVAWLWHNLTFYAVTFLGETQGFAWRFVCVYSGDISLRDFLTASNKGSSGCSGGVVMSVPPGCAFLQTQSPVCPETAT